MPDGRKPENRGATSDVCHAHHGRAQEGADARQRPVENRAQQPKPGSGFSVVDMALVHMVADLFNIPEQAIQWEVDQLKGL